VTRAFFNDGKPKSEHLPSVSAVRTTISPRVKRACGFPLYTGDGLSYVLPSDHVRRDFAFHETLDRFFCAAERDVEDRQREPDFCDSAFFRDRPTALLSDAALKQFCARSMLTHVGDFIEVVRNVEDMVVEAFAGGENDASHGDGFVPAAVGASASSRSATSDLRAAQRRACVVHQVKVESAFISGKKYGVAHDDGVDAGDFAAQCSNLDGTGAGRFFGRHWMPQSLNGGLVWLAEDGGHAVYVDSVHPNVTTDARAHHERTTGAIPRTCFTSQRPVRVPGDDTVPIVKVCVAFYADDSIIRAGRNQSAGGVYMLCPEWLVAYRVSRHAVRLIGVAPAGVLSDQVLHAISDDLEVGRTVGWLVNDQYGIPIRVFFDVGFLCGTTLRCRSRAICAGTWLWRPALCAPLKDPVVRGAGTSVPAALRVRLLCARLLGPWLCARRSGSAIVDVHFLLFCFEGASSLSWK